MATATLAPSSKTKLVNNLVGGSLGSVIDKLQTLREEKRKADAVVKEVEGRISAQEEILMERMETEGVGKASGTKATASIITATVASVTDWDLFWPWLAKKKYFHLIIKRVNDASYRELLEKGTPIPGVEPFSKRKLSLTSTKA